MIISHENKLTKVGLRILMSTELLQSREETQKRASRGWEERDSSTPTLYC